MLEISHFNIFINPDSEMLLFQNLYLLHWQSVKTVCSHMGDMGGDVQKWPSSYIDLGFTKLPQNAVLARHCPSR